MGDGKFTTVGRSYVRREDGRLLRGNGVYVADIRLPRQLHAVFVRATVPHANVTGVDPSRALAVPGVTAVLTAADLDLAPLVAADRVDGVARTKQHPLARDRVRFVGEPLAVVVARERNLAEDAAELVDVGYEPLKPTIRAYDAEVGDRLFDDLPGNTVFERTAEFGDVEAALKAAHRVVRKQIIMRPSMASPMETRGCVATYEAGAGTLRMWASTQGLHRLRAKVASCLRMRESDIFVVAHDIGGAFGQKIPAQPEEIAIAAAARHLGRPVSWIEDRAEHLIAAPRSRGTKAVVTVAVAEDGELLAFDAVIDGDAGAYSFNSASGTTEAFLAAVSFIGPYKVRNYRYRVRIGLSNTTPIAPYRGVGNVVAQTVRELGIDKSARALGMDTIALRRRNIVDEYPYKAVTGQIYDSGSVAECLEIVAERGAQALAETDAEDGRVLGFGVSPYFEGSGSGSEISMQVYGKSAPATDAATAALAPNGHLTVSLGMTSLGQGLETTMAQVAAEAAAVPFDDVSVVWSDTGTMPLSTGGTRASRVAVVGGGAIALACAELKRQLIGIGAELTGNPREAVDLRDGALVLKAGGERLRTVAELASFYLLDPASPASSRSLAVTRSYEGGATYSNACVGALVEVDTGTGGVRVLRMFAAEDCGTAINPAIVEGQFSGGAAQGLGAALFERLVYDADGQPRSTTLLQYQLPSAKDMPDIDTAHFESTSDATVWGMKGVGESGAIGTPAAIVAAIEDALRGADLQELPVLPIHVHRLVRDAQPKE